MADLLTVATIFYLLHYFIYHCGAEIVIEYSEDRKPCTYFAPTRYATAQPGLVNCSWYASRSCCKRTEVTSVFSANMLPLYQADKNCQNRINYMMCYFCSPEQFHWYKDGKVHIAEEFCDSAHDVCGSAFYNGSRLSEYYQNGTALCEARNFKVVNSKYSFKYDPTVFDRASVTNCKEEVRLKQHAVTCNSCNRWQHRKKLVKQQIRGLICSWRCSARNKKQTCSAAVIGRDNKFHSNSQENTHAQDPTRWITAKVSLKAKKNVAMEDFFHSARAVVSEAKSEVTGLTELEPINEDYLTRVTNRKREQLRPEEPKDLDFELQCTTLVISLPQHC